MSQVLDPSQESALEFDVEDLANPRSVISLTSEIPTFQAALKELLTECPDYLEMELPELQRMVDPTFTLSRLRLSFWNEYENAIQHNRKMKISKIIAGVCTETLFKKKVLPDHKKLAYLLSPPKDYMLTVKEALDAGLDNLRAIVTAKVLDEKGQLNAKAADVVLKAIALLDMRVKGAIVQRIDQRNLNVNVSNPSREVAQSVEELDRQIEEAKQKLIKQVTQSKLPESPRDIMTTMKEVNVEVISVGGANKASHE
jgi:hypothetical protein